MAKIYLNIEADSPEEYHAILHGLAVRPMVHEYVATIVDDSDQPEASAIQDAGSGEQKRRGRRINAQIAADNAAKAGAASLASGVGTATEAGTAGTGATTGLTPEPAQARAEDPFMEQVREATKDVTHTADDVRKALSAFLGGEPPKHSVNDAVAIFQRIGGADCKNVGSTPTEKYGEVIAAFQAA